MGNCGCSNNNCLGLFGGGCQSWIWILILILLFCNCGGSGFGCGNGCCD